MQYVKYFLLSTTLSISAFNAMAMQPVEKFLEKELEKTGEFSRRLCSNQTYQGISRINDLSLYDPDQTYPKMPRVHSFDHAPQSTFLGIELDSQLMSQIPLRFMEMIYEKVAIKNISFFFVAQESDENDILFRPHYYVYPTTVKNDFLHSKTISAGIFPISTPSVELDSQPQDSLLSATISTTSTFDDIKPWPNNLKINHFNKDLDSFFCSVVIVEDPTFNIAQDTNFNKNRAAVTFHYLPAKDKRRELAIITQNSKKVRDLLSINEFKYVINLGQNYTNWPSAVQSYKSSFQLPGDFNLDNYIQQNPWLHRLADQKGIDRKAYAKWHYAEKIIFNKAYIETKLLPKIREVSTHTAYLNYESFITCKGTCYKAGENPIDYWNRAWVNDKTYGPEIEKKKLSLPPYELPEHLRS